MGSIINNFHMVDFVIIPLFIFFICLIFIAKITYEESFTILYNTIITMKKKNIYNLISSLFIVISIIFLDFYLGILYNEMNFQSDNFIIFVSFIGGILYIYNIFIYLKKD
ncbi:hypothetical protein DP130_12690 [Clostridium tetani]|uniref:Uncharacterized protein n=1 Tax=Clostridium tetani TaxID=1513 RepID=A0A4Q0V9P8_CLOTA|nr:hypothetical protein DP130_12690 [Clostridium tetani]